MITIDEENKIVTVMNNITVKRLTYNDLTTIPAFLEEVEAKTTLTSDEKAKELAQIQQQIDALNAKKAKIEKTDKDKDS